jgi:hypothetical protein
MSGSLEVALGCRVRNVGSNGALLECAVPLPVRSLQVVALEIDGRETTIHVRVCHVSPVADRGAEPAYHIGVEFLSPVPWLTGTIAERLRRQDVESDAPGV